MIRDEKRHFMHVPNESILYKTILSLAENLLTLMIKHKSSNCNKLYFFSGKKIQRQNNVPVVILWEEKNVSIGRNKLFPWAKLIPMGTFCIHLFPLELKSFYGNCKLPMGTLNVPIGTSNIPIGILKISMGNALFNNLSMGKFCFDIL